MLIRTEANRNVDHDNFWTAFNKERIQIIASHGPRRGKGRIGQDADPATSATIQAQDFHGRSDRLPHELPHIDQMPGHPRRGRHGGRHQVRA